MWEKKSFLYNYIKENNLGRGEVQTQRFLEVMINKHSGTDAQISRLTRVHSLEVDKHRKLSRTLPTRWNNAHGTVMQGGTLCFASHLAILTFHAKYPASWANWIKNSYGNVLLTHISWEKKKFEESLRQLEHFHHILTRWLTCPSLSILFPSMSLLFLRIPRTLVLKCWCPISLPFNKLLFSFIGHLLKQIKNTTKKKV